MIDRRAWPGAILLAFAGIGIFLFAKPLALLPGTLLVCHLAFFRDPKRIPPQGNDFLSPADGQVVEISNVFEDRYLKQEAVRIGIFLSIFVPHVNRSPIEGQVGYLHYQPGKFLNALGEESSRHNESNWIGIENQDTRILVRQIAGLIARRICCDVSLNNNTARGEKIGIICYGSRVECYFPKRNFNPSIQVGDHVKAGETILGEWRA